MLVLHPNPTLLAVYCRSQSLPLSTLVFLLEVEKKQSTLLHTPTPSPSPTKTVRKQLGRGNSADRDVWQS